MSNPAVLFRVRSCARALAAAILFAGILAAAMPASAQTVRLAGTAKTFIQTALTSQGVAFTVESGMWAQPNSADILIMSNDGGTETPLDYTAHLNAGRHVLMIGGSNWDPFYNWIPSYVNRPIRNGWHQSSDCVSDWNKVGTHPLTQFLPSTYEFSNQATSYHMTHFTGSQPVNTQVLGRTCHEAPDNYTLVVRTYPGGGTFTYLAYDLGQYTGGNIQTTFVNPFVQGYVDFIEEGFNRPPTITNPGNQTSNEGNTVSLQISASDPDGDNLSWSATGLPPGLSINASGRITGTLSFVSSGTYGVSVTVNDGQESASTSFTWTVINVNRAPVVTNPGNQTNAENQAVTLQIAGSDADGDALSWSASGLPPGLSIAAQTGRITGTLTFNSAGSYTVVVTASDGAATGSTTFNWTVTNTNRAPAVTNPGNQTSAENQSISLQVVGSDPDGDALSWSATGLPAGLSIAAQTGRITGTLTFNSAGTYNVQVAASDGNLSTTVGFTWTVSNVNRSPVVTNPGNQSASEGQTVNLQISGVDPDGDALSWTASGLPQALSINAGTGRITGTLSFASAGTHSVTITASDGNLAGVTTFTFTVINVNRAPTVSNPGNQSSVEGASINLTVQGSDPDGDALSWSATGLPPGLSIDSGSGVISGTLSFNAAGNHQVTVAASDGSLTGSVQFTWNVGNTNRAPAVSNPGNQSSAEGQSISLQVVGSDPDGEALAWTANSLPTGLTIDRNTGRITGTISFDAAPSSPFNTGVTASDGTLSTTVTFSWTVTNTNRRPVVTNPGDQADAEGDSVTLGMAAADPDGDNLSWTATGLPPGLSVHPNTGLVSGVVSFDAAAGSPWSVTITATDGDLAGGVTFRWEIGNTNRAPVIANPADQSSAEGAAVNLLVSGSDPDGDTLTWSATGLPLGLSINANTGRITGTVSFDAGANSPFATRISASDGVATSTVAFAWIVTETNRSPVLAAIANQTHDEGASVSLQPNGSDPDGDALRWTATNLPPGLSINPLTGAITGQLTFDAAAQSPYTVGITVADATLSASVSFSWTVREVNRRPTIVSPGDQSNDEGEGLSLQMVGADPDGDAVSYTALNLPPNLVIDRDSGRITGVTAFDAGIGSPYDVTVTISDGVLTASVMFRWTIGETNRPPVVTNPGTQTSFEGANVALNIVASDPDGEVLTYSATGLPAGLAINAQTGAITGTITFDASEASPYSTVVTVTDGAANGSATFTWVVRNTNRAPVATNPGGQSNAEGDTVSLAIVASDPDGDRLGYSATGLPRGLTIHPTTGLISGVLPFDAAQAYTTAVTASDGFLDVTVTFAWTVTNTNRAPVVVRPGDQSSAEGDVVNLNLTATDADGEVLTWSSTTLPTGLTLNPATGVISGTIDFGASENSPYDITLTVSDGAATGTATFRWVVRSTNRRPTAVNPGAQTHAEGQAVSVTVNATDPDDDELSWAATNLPPGLRIAPDTGAITGTVSYDASDASPYTVVVIVSDGSLTHAVSFQWTITNTNRAPTVATGGPYDIAEGGSAALSATGSDPDGTVLTYTWDLDDDGVFDDATGPTATFEGVDGPSSHSVAVRVSDGTANATATATVTVRNLPPIITAMTANPPTPAESVEVSFAGAALDPAGEADPLTYSWTFGDGSPPASGAAAVHTYTDNGTYTVVLTVADDDGGVVTRTLSVTVGDAPPNLSAIAGSPVVDEGASNAWSATLTKALGDTAAWTVQWGDGTLDLTGSLPVGVAQGTVGGSHTYADDGTFVITIRAVDDDAQVATTTLEVTVRNVDPTITVFNPSTEGDEGEVLPFSAAATDPGADALTFTWDFGDGQFSVGTDVSHAYAGDGRYTVTLTVTDGDGGTAVRSADVTIGDAAPSITSLTGDLTGPEGGTFRYVAAATDPGGDALTYTWSFGDGTPDAVGVDRRTVTHVYADNGSFDLRLSVSDGQATVTQSLTITVSNVAPTFVDVTAPGGGLEGQLLSFAAVATDPGADTLTYTWDFGDDTPVVTGPTADHIFGDDGVYFAQLVVVDDDGGRAARALTIVIRNVAPSIVRLNGIFTGPEGTEFDFDAVVEDPGNDTPTFEWNFGDGSPIETGENLSAVTHVYGRRGSFTLVLTVRDEDGGTAIARRTVNVGGEAPSVDTIDGDRLGDEGQLLAFTAQASEPGNDLITYSWDFGDGSPAQSGIDLQNVSHAYAEDGRYTLTLTATDADGDATATLDITVRNVAPTIVTVTAPPTGREGEVLAFAVDATDPGGANDPLTYRWTWGDGTPSSTGRSPTHAYARGGSYTVQVTVTDDEDASSSATRTVVIDNVAPTIARLFGPTSGDEGSTLQYSAAVTDPGAGDLRYTWSFGDGSPNQTGVDLDEVAHAFADNGVYVVALVVEDESGDTAEAEVEVTINNVAPLIISQPPQVARLGVPYLYDVQVRDPGADEISFELLEGPAGMTFAGNFLMWDLAIDQIEGGPYAVSIRVSDDDGATVDQEWEIRTDFDDIDMDGVPDDCELLYGLDPNDPDDGDQDLDMDGISNRDECLQGLDPTVFNGPSAPGLVSPIDRARVAELMPTLVVTNSTDPDGDVLLYELEIFADEELTDQVAAAVEIAEGVDETSWQSEVELTDNSRYWWRARAADRFVSGPWSVTGAFVVDMENEPPTVPNPVSPVRGADTTTPDLLVDPSTDPEGDIITYDFQVFSDEGLETLVSEGSAADVTWTVADALTEGSWYWWRARATDEAAASSDWSDSLSFKVNTANTLPDGPKIVAPRPNERVEIVPVLVIWDQAADAQDDPLLYELELATDEAFSDIVTAAIDIPMGDEATVTYALPPDLQEDAEYWVRVRASDFEGAGPWASLPFVVNAQNTPAEAPTLISPIANETVVAGDVPLVVSGGTDPDGQGITYTVRVFDDAATNVSVFEIDGVPPEGVETTIVWADATAGVYYWTAAATDAGGLQGPFADVEQFEVLDRPNTAPTAPVAVSPINDQDVDPTAFDLVVENATDPEGDELTYSFAIYADEELTQLLWSDDAVSEGASGQTTVAVDDLTTTRSKLWWVAFATDSFGAAGPRSEAATFTIVKTVAAPALDDCECSAPAHAPVPHWILLAGVAVILPLLRRRS